MRNLVAGSLVAAALTLGMAGVPALAADADPSVQQIYEAARTGHLDQAQQMINQVLRDHPQSSKAHYVQAELYAREGNLGLARSELARAEQLDPGLTKENPRAVQELKAQLGIGTVRRNEGSFSGVTGGTVTTAPAAAHFPWGTVVILALVVGVFWMLFRRRSPYPAPYQAGAAPGAYGPGGYAGPAPAMARAAVSRVAELARTSRAVWRADSRPARASLQARNWHTTSSTAIGVKNCHHPATGAQAPIRMPTWAAPTLASTIQAPGTTAQVAGAVAAAETTGPKSF